MDQDAGSPTRTGLRGYISYSRVDADDVSRLEAHLRGMSTGAERVDFWTDAVITDGEPWFDRIAAAIETADVFIACMSADYLASEFRYHVEWPRILHRVRTSLALVVPVILRPCMWYGFVDTFQAVPRVKGRVRPVSNWRPQESGYHHAALAIAEAIHDHFAHPDRREPWPPIGAELDLAPAVPFAPAGSEKLSPEDIDQAVKAVISRRSASSVN